jgi:phage gp36-like protein
MTYCTLTQLEDRYGLPLLLQVSDRSDVYPTAPDADLFARAIADAEGIIDGYVRTRYALPLAQVPALLTDLAQRIAIYTAHSSVASEKIRTDYTDAIKLLEKIASGLVTLSAAGVEPASSGGGGVTTNTPDRPLTSETMKGYI